ncbi:TadE family type IV pilus minor pilin [Lysobacter korlensis]|uniref:TadE family type IV pilus minor pilin n=1 Tax=Lysobacter korlensis TaxID=553636 RepID=A0ABV6RZS6_9GAMM
MLLMALALGALAVGSQSVRLQDAAGLTARALARGDPPPAAEGIAGVLVPGAVVSRRDRAGLVCVVLTARAPGPLSALELRAESCALAER